MIVTIPSYKRAGAVTTLDMLQGGFSKDEIILGTQTESDYKAYSRLYGERCIVIYREGSSLPVNRNNLLEYAQSVGGKEMLMLDDDLKHIRTITDKKIRGKEFRELMEKCFEFSRKNGIVMFGSYATDNKLSMKRTVTRNIIDGMLCGILDLSIRYDKNFTTKSDYEMSLRLMQQGRKVIRFNSFAPTSTNYQWGGVSEFRKMRDNHVIADWLVQAYPQLVTYHPTRKGEIKFIG